MTSLESQSQHEKAVGKQAFLIFQFFYSLVRWPKLRFNQRYVFLLLMVSQFLHSIEEVHFGLWEVFAPARFISGLINSNLELGFIIANVLIVCVGFVCALFLFRYENIVGKLVIGFWIILETVNFSVHTFMAIKTWGYFPGIYTAPLLLFFSGLLLIVSTKHASQHGIT